MSTKKQRRQEVELKTEAEKNRVFSIIKGEKNEFQNLDSLIESYLEIFEIYYTFFIEWRDKGFPATKKHTNKAGVTNEMKHPLAQLVETWTDKKTKALDLLGLTAKSFAKQRTIDIGKEEPEGNTQPKDELAAHRNKWRRDSG
jgi:phage terminase small subunit